MNSTGKTVAKAAFTIAKIGAGLWLALIVADVLTLVWLYSNTSSFLQGRGVSEYQAKMMAVLWSAMITYIMNRVLWAVVKRDRTYWVPRVAGIWVLALAVMYFVTAPYIGSPFDPFSGKAQKYYIDQRGEIHMIGTGAVTGPNGEDVKTFDKAAAQKYEQQQKKRGLRPVSEKRVLDKPWNPFQSKTQGPELQMEVESVELFPDRTVVRMSVQRMDDYKSGRFYRAPANNQLVDAYGETYRFQHDTAQYADIVDSDTHEPLTPAQEANRSFWDRFNRVETKYIKPKEVYRFESIYAPVPPDVESLEMYDYRFEPVDITFALGPAKYRLAQRKTQEAKNVAEAQAQAALDLKAAQQAELKRLEQEQAERDAALVRSVMSYGVVEARVSKIAEMQTRVDSAKAALAVAQDEYNRASRAVMDVAGSQLRRGPDGKVVFVPLPVTAQYDAMNKVKQAEKYLEQVSAEAEQVRKQPSDGSYVILRSDVNISRRLPSDVSTKWNALKVKLRDAEAAVVQAKGIYKRAYEMQSSFSPGLQRYGSQYGPNTAQDLQRAKDQAQETLARTEEELAQVKAEIAVLWEETRRWWESDGLV